MTIHRQTASEVCDNVIEELHDILKEFGESEDYRLVEAIADLQYRVTLWKERPDIKSLSNHRTYESCHKHFSCPDGEECWYASEDYYWDCGKGAAKLHDSWVDGTKFERKHVLKLIEISRDALQEKQVDGNYDVRTHAKIEILSWLLHQIESSAHVTKSDKK